MTATADSVGPSRVSDGSPRLEGSIYQTANGEQLILRHCRGFSEFEACVELQQQTWGYDDRDMMPRKGFLLAQELGGQVIGAFDRESKLVAFAMSMAAVDPAQTGTRPYLHSHMLAVRPQYRRSGVGRRLKLVQREDAMARGFDLMTWTFDPLAARNAHLNLHRLGVIVRRYSPDFYGVSSSRLQAGLPSDRLHAEWWLRSNRVASHVETLLPPTNSSGAASMHLGSESARPALHAQVELPAEIEQWKTNEATRELALAVQAANRERFTTAFSSGLVVTDFCLDPSGGGRYQLTPWTPTLTNLEDSL